MEPRSSLNRRAAGLLHLGQAGWAAVFAAQLALGACSSSAQQARDPFSGSEIDLTRGSGADERGLLPASAVEPNSNDEAETASEDLPQPGIDFPVERIARAKLPQPTAENPSRGPNDARVVVQVFSDFECPFCARVHPVIRKLEQLYAGQIRIVWRNFPLAAHPHARGAARAGVEAFVQGGSPAFWRLHDRMFETARVDEAMLVRHAEVLRLDMTRFKQNLREKTHDAQIERDVAAGLSAGVVATPSVLVNDYLLTGAYPLVAFRAVVERAISEAH